MIFVLPFVNINKSDDCWYPLCIELHFFYFHVLFGQNLFSVHQRKMSYDLAYHKGMICFFKILYHHRSLCFLFPLLIPLVFFFQNCSGVFRSFGIFYRFFFRSLCGSLVFFLLVSTVERLVILALFWSFGIFVRVFLWNPKRLEQLHYPFIGSLLDRCENQPRDIDPA